MIYSFFQEFKALMRFKTLLKRGKINEAALAYRDYITLSNDVESQVAAEIAEAKNIFREHTAAVDQLKQELEN